MGDAVTTVTKEFHFYAAHRNEEIGGKCGNIHGHRYGLTVTVQEPRNCSVTVLFEDLERWVQREIVGLADHSLLLNRDDPCADALVSSGACGKVFWIDGPTSCENLAELFFSMLRSVGANVVSLTLKETDTSSVTVSAHSEDRE